jgi:hypothetical protein
MVGIATRESRRASRCADRVRSRIWMMRGVRRDDAIVDASIDA